MTNDEFSNRARNWKRLLGGGGGGGWGGVKGAGKLNK
jgi:hypothetical protein